VLGHHPHVLQSIERYKDGLIAYSLGNFVFDMSASRTYETAALRLVVSGGRLRRADVVPLLIGRMSYAPALLPPAAAKSRLEDVLLWSSRLGTKLLIDGSTGSVFF
jgi:poly-gamma-glutamate synthesis protein (capsule biosynthesis protein)